MTGLYSEAQDDSSADLPQDNSESEATPNNDQDASKNIPGIQQQPQPQSVIVSTTLANPSVTTTCITSTNAIDTVIKCHSRQPSNSAGLMEKNYQQQNEDADDELSRDCGILSCRPAKIQKLARIKVGLNFLFFPVTHSLTHVNKLDIKIYLGLLGSSSLKLFLLLFCEKFGRDLFYIKKFKVNLLPL